MQNVVSAYGAPTIKLLMVKEPGACPQAGKIIVKPEDAAEILRPLEFFPEEKFLIVLLDVAKTVIGVVEVSHGSIACSIVHPREVFKTAILANADSFVAAHNHPAGTRRASKEDIATTRVLIEASRIMGIDMLDHLIITQGQEPLSLRTERPDLWAN